MYSIDRTTHNGEISSDGSIPSVVFMSGKQGCTPIIILKLLLIQYILQYDVFTNK